MNSNEIRILIAVFEQYGEKLSYILDIKNKR